MKKLIINADDFGPILSTNKSIIDSHLNGIVTSTSIIPNLSNLKDISESLKLNKNLGTGAHLVFTMGKPILDSHSVKSLINDQGNFLTSEQIMLEQHNICEKELYLEFLAQMELFKKFRFKLTHIDVHHPVIYFIPKLFEVTITIAKNYKLPIRFPYAINSKEIINFICNKFLLDKILVKKVSSYLKDQVIKSSVKHPDYLYPKFTMQNTTFEYFLEIIEGLKEGISEIFVHPNINTPKGIKELKILLDPRLKNAINDNNIELVNYRVFEND